MNNWLTIGICKKVSYSVLNYMLSSKYLIVDGFNLIVPSGVSTSEFRWTRKVPLFDAIMGTDWLTLCFPRTARSWGVADDRSKENEPSVFVAEGATKQLGTRKLRVFEL